MLDHVAARVRFGEDLDEACRRVIDDVNAGRIVPSGAPQDETVFFVEELDDDGL
ncbi:MAG: hypothetical protein H0V29_03920 [Thermoleophilaceae bacterium]|nr:hypothetical protein [Thermoleophilaceae bacterium]